MLRTKRVGKLEYCWKYGLSVPTCGLEHRGDHGSQTGRRRGVKPQTRAAVGAMDRARREHGQSGTMFTTVTADAPACSYHRCHTAHRRADATAMREAAARNSLLR